MKSSIDLKKIREKILFFLNNLVSKEDKENAKFWQNQLTLFSQRPKDLIQNIIDKMHQKYAADEADAKITNVFMILLKNKRSFKKIPDELLHDIILLRTYLYYPASILAGDDCEKKPQYFYPKAKKDTYSINIQGKKITSLFKIITHLLLVDFLIAKRNVIENYVKENPKKIEDAFLSLKSFNERWLQKQLQLIQKVVKRFITTNFISRFLNILKALNTKFRSFVKAPSQYPKSFSLLGGIVVSGILFIISLPLSIIISYTISSSLIFFNVNKARNDKFKNALMRHKSTQHYDTEHLQDRSIKLAYDDGTRASLGYFEYFKSFARRRDWKYYDNFAAAMQTTFEAAAEEEKIKNSASFD